MNEIVSIIIPVCNAEKYLTQCLESVAAQTYTNIEVILVYDNSPGGSRDSSPDMCNKFVQKDSRFIHINQKNLGLGPARDAGIDAAKGEWICFVDADDIISPRYVERMLSITNEHDCLMVKCGTVQFVSENELIEYNSLAAEQKSELMNWRAFYVSLLYDPVASITVWNKLYHCSLLTGLRFGNHKLFEDNIFTPRAIYEARAKKIAVVEDVLYFYRVNPMGLYRNKSADYYEQYFSAHKENIEFMKEISEPVLYDAATLSMTGLALENYLTGLAEKSLSVADAEFIKSMLSIEGENIKRLYPEWFPKRIVSKSEYDKICSAGIVIYGYGARGREIHRLLKVLDINVIDIWDKQGTPIKQGLHEETLIIIAIANRCDATIAELELRDNGYGNFMSLLSAENAIKSKIISEHLPFLL